MQLGLDRNTARLLVTSVIGVPVEGATFLADVLSTLVTVSIDYLDLREPTANLTVSLQEGLSGLNSVQSLGGIRVDADGSYGYQGIYLSGMCTT